MRIVRRGTQEPSGGSVRVPARSRAVALARSLRTLTLALLIVVATLAVGGCRRPDPVYDRIPRPLSTRDVVRAERRDGTPLSETERLLALEIHDRYLAAFEALRVNELVPFAADYRTIDGDGAYGDPRRLRSLVSRHMGIVQRIEGLDEQFLSELAAGLGPERTRFIAHLKTRRTIDRASALSAGDGGRTLLDVRLLVEQLGLDPTERTTVEPILEEFDAQAAQLAREIGAEQATLPLSYMAVIERRGPAERSVDPSLRDEARKQARERAEFERYAESRRDLESLLFRYADLADETIESVAATLSDEDAAFLRRRLLRLRFDDEVGGGGDRAAFEALVASRTQSLPRELRDRIETMRAEFVALDEGRMRELAALHRSSREPGVYDALRARSGPDQVKAHKERWAELEQLRKTSAKEFREAVFALLPDETRGAIEQLRGLDRERFVASLAELVGPGRVPSMVQRKPRGFADRDPPRQDFDQRRDGDPGELRMMLAAAPDDTAIALLQSRSRVDPGSTVVIREIVAAWRERWEATREPARARVQQLMAPIMASMNGADPKAFDQAAARLISGFDELRRERSQLDDDLLSSIEAALPDGLDPAARELWVRERAEASRRLRWRDLPFNDAMRLPPEATVGFMDAIARAPIDPERAPAIVGALAPYADRLDEATETLRDRALVAVRKAMALVMEGRKSGKSEEQSLSESRPEVRAALAPMREAANDLAVLRLEALASIAASLPPNDGRAIREQFVRAAYPRLLDERRSTERSLTAVGDDPSLSDVQYAAWQAIMTARSATRDAALDRLLAWGADARAEGRPLGGEVNGRDVASRRHPQLAAVFFERDEADARAVRACSGLLSEEQRRRHDDLEEWFTELPSSVRWLD